METLSFAKRQEDKSRRDEIHQPFSSQATKPVWCRAGLKKLEKIQTITIPRTTKKIHFAFPEPPHSGREVISLKHIKKAYGEK